VVVRGPREPGAELADRSAVRRGGERGAGRLRRHGGGADRPSHHRDPERQPEPGAGRDRAAPDRLSMAVSYPRQPWANAPAGLYAPARKRWVLLDGDLVMRLDWILIAACLAIVMIGMLMIYSSSRTLVGGDSAYYVKRQALALAVGVGIGIALIRIDYRKL